jgi:hypothetical protein
MPIANPSWGLDITGLALTWQKITPGNTATAIDASIYKYEERTLAFTSGGTAELTAGKVIRQSGVQAVIKSVTVATGTWAGGDAAGTFTLHSQVGAFTAGSIYTGAGSDDATVAGDSTAATATGYGDMYAKKLLIEVLDNTAMITIGPVLADQTYKMGLHIPALGTLEIYDRNQMKECKVIDAVSGSASNIIVIGIF